MATRSGIEKSVYQDPETGRTIWRLTNSQIEDKHSYYDISPWSPDGKYLVFSSALPQDLGPNNTGGDNFVTSSGLIYIMDTENYEIMQIAKNTLFNTHTGAFAVWHPIENKVYFNRSSGKIGLVNLENPEEKRVIEGDMRQFSPDGQKIVTTSNDSSFKEGQGVYTMNEDGSELKRILSTEALYEITPNRDKFSIENMTVGNTKWTPNSQHMLVAMWVKHWSNPIRRSIYVVSKDGSKARWLTYFGGHHSWTPDGKQVLHVGYKTHTDEEQKDRRLFLTSFDGLQSRVVIEEEMGSHPLMNPTNTMITDWDQHGVVVVHIKEQRVERLASFGEGFKMDHEGTHPHSVWSPDGKQILYNSAQTGTSQLYQIPMEE